MRGGLRAEDGGHFNISTYLQSLISIKSVETVMQCDFDAYASAVLQYGNRWGKLYDVDNDALYYLDRITNASQWERPTTYDWPQAEELEEDTARTKLIEVYKIHNPAKLSEINNILFFYKQRYKELLESLNAKYN